MKFTSTLLLTLWFFAAQSQDWKFTSYYSLALPQQEMGSNIQGVHSLQVGALYQLPGKLKNLSVGFELGIGSYAQKRIDQSFTFDNITSIVPVNYTSNAFNANLQARFDLLDTRKSMVTPYINARAGMYNLFSNIFVEDPHDPNGCRVLERESIINAKTLYWSIGGGIQLNPAIFSKDKYKRRLLIDLGVNTIRGGDISYINTKHLLDAAPDDNGKPLNVRFVNAATNSIHEHKVAQVYTSPLRLFEIRAGITVMLGKNG